jgi:hypothetical protein
MQDNFAEQIKVSLDGFEEINTLKKYVSRLRAQQGMFSDSDEEEQLSDSMSVDWKESKPAKLTKLHQSVLYE